MNRNNNLFTGKERAINGMLNKPTDRTSVHPAIDVSYAAKLYGKNVGECFIDPELHAKALENVFSVHPEIDGLYINLCLSPRSFENTWKEGSNTYILDNGGMTWVIPLDDVGSVGGHQIKEIDDDRLKARNPLEDGIIDTYTAISKEIKDRYLIVPGLTGPFSQLVFMLGLTETLLLTLDQPNELKQALEWRTQKAIEWADTLIKIGVDCVWIGEGAASSSIISPETYSEFVLPLCVEGGRTFENKRDNDYHACMRRYQSIDWYHCKNRSRCDGYRLYGGLKESQRCYREANMFTWQFKPDGSFKYAL